MLSRKGAGQELGERGLGSLPLLLAQDPRAGRQTKAAPCKPNRASGINPAVEQATHPLPLPLWPPPFKQKQPPFRRLPRLEEGHRRLPPPPPPIPLLLLQTPAKPC